MQEQEPAGPPPPAGFEAYEKNENAGGVMGMIKQIITDAKALEAEAIRAEEDSQKSYEDFVKKQTRPSRQRARTISTSQRARP